MTDTESQATTAFIERSERSGAAERSNHQLFISELFDLIGVPRPNPATPDNSQNAYIFERAVTFQHGDGKSSSLKAVPTFQVINGVSSSWPRHQPPRTTPLLSLMKSQELSTAFGPQGNRSVL